MATTPIFTYTDVLQSMLDWCNVPTTDAVTLRKIKRAIQSAYREFFESRTWAVMMDRSRIVTQPVYNTGTIAYTNSTRTITLTGGTFPSWANLGRIVFGSPALEYQVVANPSSTTLTLSVNVNPGADVAAGTAYQLWQDTYPLPVNCQSLGTLKDAQRNVVLQYMEPNDWVALRPYNTYPTIPRFYTVTSDPSYLGALCIRLLPPPDIQYNLDFEYKRMPRQFSVAQNTTGTITSVGTAVTGVGTTFSTNPNMVGCMIRSARTSKPPTGLEGTNPYVEQRVVTSVGSATGLTIDQAFSTDISSPAAFEISDPIEMESNAMYTAFLRRCEADLGPVMRRDDVANLKAIAHEAWIQACESDSRSMDMKPDGARYFQRVPTYWTITNSM